MQKLILAIALTVSSIWLVSCGNSPTDIKTETTTNSVTPAKTEAVQETSTDNQPQTKTTPQVATKEPKTGTIKEMVNGDLKCYVTLVDENGKQHNLGASFDVCAQPKTLVNKKVSLSYSIESVSDCQSAEPCGKSKKELLITKIEILNSEKSQSNSQTLSNGEWKITIGNRDSWSGVNGTGNLTYKGCDLKNNCIDLTGGKITCRDGKCITGWKNGEYIYTLEQPITEEGANSASSSILKVKKGSSVILTAQGLKSI
ncbi:MAG: hypothetical protein KME23_21650 [Goleter apudmare HA4340-LM2]|jgi:hypothetical protein|nr:hypothetical protein [Goleter apudmare HA4340-LM2]